MILNKVKCDVDEMIFNSKKKVEVQRVQSSRLVYIYNHVTCRQVNAISLISNIENLCLNNRRSYAIMDSRIRILVFVVCSISVLPSEYYHYSISRNVSNSIRSKISFRALVPVSLNHYYALLHSI